MSVAGSESVGVTEAVGAGVSVGGSESVGVAESVGVDPVALALGAAMVELVALDHAEWLV